MDTVKAAFTSYLSHLAAYVISGVTIVSTLAPGTLPPKYAFITAIATAMAAAFSHGKAVQTNGASIATAVANAFTDAVNSAPASVPGSAVAPVGKVVAMLLLIPLLLTLHACASVQSFIGSPTGQTVVTAGVQVAVTTAEQKGASAAQINSVAKAVLAADSGATATVTALTGVVNAQLVKLNVPQGDLVAFQGLELAFDAYLVAKYGNNTTVQNVQSDVALFCNAVIAATGG